MMRLLLALVTLRPCAADFLEAGSTLGSAATEAEVSPALAPAGRLPALAPSTNLGLLPALAAWTPETVPAPDHDPKRCGVTQPGPVCDPDGSIPPRQMQKILNVIAVMGAMTNVTCQRRALGYQAAVLIVDGIAPSEWVGSDKTETAHRFAEQVGDTWGVGDGGCGNGLLLFVSITDRMFYLLTARVTKEVLTNSRAATVLDNMKPFLKQQLYGDAVLHAMVDSYDILDGKQISGEETDWGTIVTIIVLSVVLSVVSLITCCYCCGGCLTMILGSLVWCILYPFAACLDCCCSYCCSKRRRTLCEDSSGSDSESASGSDGDDRKVWNDLKRVQEELERDEFDQTICAVCLDHLENLQETLSCGHKFHRACIKPWLRDHIACPLCRSTVSRPAPLMTVDGIDDDQQVRAGFFLSRLQERHAEVFGEDGRFSRDDSGYYSHRYRNRGCCGDSYSQPYYYYDYYPHGHYYQSWHGGHASSSGAYTLGLTDALNARYEGIMDGGRSAWQASVWNNLPPLPSGGGSSGGGGATSFSFGGGDFSGGGGAGGGW